MKIEICGIEYTEEDVPLSGAKEALLCQDACNFSGVLFSFAERMRELCEHPRNCGTAWKNHHPVAVLFLSKLNSLCTGDCCDVNTFSNAYELITQVVNTAPEERK